MRVNVARTLLTNPDITVGDVADRLAGYHPQRCIDTCPPRGRQTALRTLASEAKGKREETAPPLRPSPRPRAGNRHGGTDGQDGPR